jgi:hypothetical protein
MTIEIGFGRPWWITRRSIVAGWALHSHGGGGAEHWTAWYLRVQIGRFAISPHIAIKSRAKFLCLIGFVYQDFISAYQNEGR